MSVWTVIHNDLIEELYHSHSLCCSDNAAMQRPYAAEMYEQLLPKIPQRSNRLRVSSSTRYECNQRGL